MRNMSVHANREKKSGQLRALSLIQEVAELLSVIAAGSFQDKPSLIQILQYLYIGAQSIHHNAYHGSEKAQCEKPHRVELQKLCKERELCARKKTTKLDLETSLSANEKVTKMQSQPEDEDPNVEHLDEGGIHLKMEDGLAVCL
ncbi:hypothetical protein NDU88_002803 [Pleurodeles waltl]|uniref:Uncharacterized protein n=1 Tax=Pleurodeles waltl TaxID=8319 RepID=A0AAV7NN02_PLEWA|nr:hypothetical protein NDU88_002803 [Pleurodeles waltl]